jgi:glucose/arabinose dehydrogenase
MSRLARCTAFTLVGVVLFGARTAQATFHLMQIEQVIGGVNGDNTAQAIQLRMRLGGQNLLAPARIRVFDAAGLNPIVIVNFGVSVPNGAVGSRVLIASANFSTVTTPAAAPDFTMTNLIPASYLAAGSMTFETDNGLTIYWRLSWGGASYTGPNTGAIDNDANGNFGPPWPGPLPSTCERALQFEGNATAASTTNAADYSLTAGAASFINNAGGPANTFTVDTVAGACCADDECSDGVACTDDTCTAGSCGSVPNDANCPDDGLFCTGPETCDPALDCVGDPPCVAGEICNEALDQCEPGAVEIVLQPIASGLAAPIDLTHAGDGSGRLFVADQAGQIRIIDASGNLLPTPFLDISAKLPVLGTIFDERGLLGLAFHPDYESNGRFFVRYSAPREGLPEEPCNDPGGFIVGCHKEVLAEYAVSADPNIADPDSEIILIEVDKPQFNHNSGAVQFGPDGLLYYTLGDGGGANDGLADVPPSHGPNGNGQNLQALLGKILRIDVNPPFDPGLNYAIPPDNPFADGVDGLPEIYGYGLRNPFKFSFDDGPGGDQSLYLADVGQNLIEEVNIVSNGGNYGWVIREGTFCFDPFDPVTPPVSCANTGPLGEPLLDPIMEYFHPVSCLANSDCAFLGVDCGENGLCENEGGIAIVGGFVYRGSSFPELVGKYVFGDFASDFFAPSGRLYYFDTSGPDVFQRVQFSLAPNNDPFGLFLKGFGEDEADELYVLASVDLPPSGTSGVVLRITRPCASADDCGDLDNNNLRDDACQWYACMNSVCQTLSRDAGQADMGGANGACPIEGACDGNDRFHALNCFSDQDTMGNAGAYPCEAAPPAALNVDAGGPSGSCTLDGVCDGNDAFAALNCFSNVDTAGMIPYPCSCSGPQPSGPPAGSKFEAPAAAIRLRAPAQIEPGQTVEVEVFFDRALPDLRGYQLHLGTAGGHSGRLELVDIAVEPGRRDHVFTKQPFWAAFNTRVAQMVAGLDGAGVPTPAGGYLATFAYRASDDAAGVFEVNVRFDGANPQPEDRTFLFGTHARPIAVDHSTPLSIRVGPKVSTRARLR